VRRFCPCADSSLLDEWEALLDPAASAEEKSRRLAAAQAHRQALAARHRRALARTAHAQGGHAHRAASALACPRPPDCIVDLTQPRPGDEPLLELVRIGT